MGRLERPASEPLAYALFAHCFTCSKDVRAVGGISRALAERGYAVLRFDFTGLGESEGDFAGTNFSSNLGDLAAAAEFLRMRYRAPRLLIGHSLGGAAALVAARRIPECVAVATIAAPSDTEHLHHLLIRKAPAVLAEGVAQVRIGGRTFTVTRQLLEDLAQRHVEESLAALGRALLIMHSPADTVVGIDHAERLFAGASHPKSFVSLDGADHLLSSERDLRFAAETLAAWCGRYL